MAIVDAIVGILRGAQTEILIFVVAIGAHALLFGKHKVRGRSGGRPQQKTAPSAPTASKERGSFIPVSPKVVPGVAVAAFVRAVQALLAERAGEEDFCEELRANLRKAAVESRAEVLASLLASIGRAASVEFIAACRSVGQELGIHASVGLHEALLRALLSLRAMEMFNEVAADAERAHGAVPRLAALAARAAVLRSDADAALARLPALAAAWKTVSPSTAQTLLFQQITRLVVDKSMMSTFLDHLLRNGLVMPWTVEVLLAQCAGAGDVQATEHVCTLASEKKVELTGGAHAALLQASTEAWGAGARLRAAAQADRLGKDVFLAALDCASRFADSTLAQEILELVPKTPAPEVASALLKQCAPGGLLAGKDADATILDIYAGRLGGVPLAADAATERLVVESALRRGRTDVLQMLLSTLSESSRRVALLKSLASEKRLQDCLAVFRACEPKSSCLYNAVVDACMDVENAKLAESIVAEAVAAKLADTVTYNTMIKAHLKRDDLPRARATLASMREAGFQPNSVTFNEFLNAATRDRVETMWALLDEMKACGCQPNHVTCSIVLKSVSKTSRAGEVEKALAVIESMGEPMDEVLLSSVCEACIRSGRTDLLHQQLQLQKGPRSVAVKGAQTFGSLIRAYGALNDVDGVWDTWREMRRRHVAPTSVTIGCTVEALSANGQVDAAYELIQEQMRDPRARPMINAIVFCSVLKGYSHRKRFDRVWRVYEEMKSHGVQFSVVTYNTLVDACARSCDMGRIPALLEEMAAQNLEPNIITYSAIVKGYCQENRVDRAFDLLEDMKKMKGFRPDEVTYNTLIDGCARYGMWGKGMSVLAEMQDAGVSPSAFTLSVLVKLANRSKRPEEGFELVESLCAKYRIRMTVHVYANLILAASMMGDLDKAIGVMEQMLRAKVRPDSRSYVLLLRCAVATKAPQDAAGILRAAGGLGGAHPRLSVFPQGALRPTTAVPEEATTEVLEGLAAMSGGEALALQLACDLHNAKGVAFDPRVATRLASKAARKMPTSQWR